MSKVALITGTSSGIGLLTAVEMARRGYTVVATMRDLARRGRLDAAAAAAGVGNNLEVRPLDVTQFDCFPALVADLVRRHGSIDILVNNAGFVVAGFAEDMTLAELRQQFETNFFGQVALTQAVLPVMRRQRAGKVIMVSSISGRIGSPGTSCYCASKFALEGWSETLRIEMRPFGVHVVLVEPGAFQTDIWDRNTRISERILQGQSPNQERGRRLKEWAQTTPKADPAHVARRIARIADARDPRLRYLIGRDAIVESWLKALLPWKTFERLVARTVGIG